MIYDIISIGQKNEAFALGSTVTTITQKNKKTRCLNFHTGAFFICRSKLVLFSSKDLEQEGKDVDDIQVDTESCKDVLFWTYGVALVPHEKLGVKC